MKDKIEIFWQALRKNKLVFILFFMVYIFLPHTVFAAGPSGPVPQTGQTTSATAGDDGTYKKGVAWPVPRFTDNGDGTVFDALTGLIWMKNANCWGLLTWANALTNVAGLNAGTTSCTGYTTGTHTDWRLPSFRELQSLIDLSKYSPALPAGHPFVGVQSDVYWSSTTIAYYTADAWLVYLNYGNVFGYDKTYTFNVWPVRGGQ